MLVKLAELAKSIESRASLFSNSQGALADGHLEFLWVAESLQHRLQKRKRKKDSCHVRHRQLDPSSVAKSGAAIRIYCNSTKDAACSRLSVLKLSRDEEDLNKDNSNLFASQKLLADAIKMDQTANDKKVSSSAVRFPRREKIKQSLEML